MEYFDAPEANPGQDGVCSDNDCPCGYPGATIPRGTGYLYISKELVDFRRDALTVALARMKLERMRSNMPGAMIIFDPSISMPILMCEQGARKRGLDLEVAAADARYWWQYHKAPLRPTPLEKDKTAAPAVQKISTAADVAKETRLPSPVPAPPAWSPPVYPPPAWYPPSVPQPARPNNKWVWWLVGTLGFLFLAILTAIIAYVTIKNNKTSAPAAGVGSPGETLRVGSDFTWPPYEYIDDEGNYAGFDVEVMELIAGEINAEVTWEDTPWDTLFAKVSDGQVDLAISGIGYSEERDAIMDFSIPYLEIPDIFLVKKGFSGSISKPEDLAAYQVGVQLGTMQDDWLDTKLISSGVLDGVQVLRYDNLDSAISDLLSQQSDVVIMDGTQATRYMALHPELQVAFERENPDSNLYIVFPTGSDQLRQSVNRAIAELKSTGAIEQLYEEVFQNYP